MNQGLGEPRVSDTVRQDVGTQERFAHEAVFYDGPAQHARAVLPFIREGVPPTSRSWSRCCPT